MATNVFDLFAKISLDSSGYEKGLKDAGSKFSEFGDGLKNAAGKIGDVLLGIGKAAAAGVAAAGTALTALTKQSLDAVANYEQLAGGVEKIFGEESAKKVIAYAEEAYASAGMSANEYMETVTNFSATLIAGLKGDTEKAADIANMAIKDMADNANTFGTNLDSVQSAYQAFAKQNYTLLDNLKLGYGGTAREMARLLNESGVLGDALINLDDTKGLTQAIADAGFDKIIEAIHVIQEELNITGTTTDEAGRTITGSIASMKAAWENFLTGTGTPEQFTEVLSTSIENIKKNLKDIIPRLVEGLTELVDLLAPEIPPIIQDVLPAIIDGASTLLTGLAERLPELISSILPSVSQGIIDVSTAIVKVLPSLITSLKETIPIILTAIWEKKDELLQAGRDIISSLIPSDEEIEKLPSLISGAAKTVIEFAAKLTNPENLKKVIDKGFEIITALIDGLTSEETLDQFFDPDTGIIKVIENLSDALVHFVFKLAEAATKIIKNLGDYLNDKENRKQLFEAAKGVLVKIGQGLTSKEAKEAVTGLIVTATQFLINTFIGGVDWNASGAEIARRVVIGFFDNITAIPQWIGEKAYDITHKPIAGENGAHYAKGGIFTRPTYGLIGEDGAEVVMPLEKNTEWIDKLADRISNRGGNGISIGEINVTVSGEDRADRIGEMVVQSIDEALKKYQITQNRGVGAVTW